MKDRYFEHIVGCLEASIKAAEDGVNCYIPVVVVQNAVDLLKEKEVKEQISDAIHETAKQFRQTIVRCKECRYSEHDPETNHLRCQHPFGLSGMTHGADWFCADGERKEGR